MSYASDRLREFHEAFDVTSTGSYRDRCRARLALHEEEADEVEDALDELGRSIKANRREKLEALAGELADELVIAYGTADLLGVDLDVAFRLKMDANMAKLPECPRCKGTGEVKDKRGSRGTIVAMALCGDCNGSGKGKPIKRPEDGKVLKPANWQAPSMEEAIR